MRMPTFLIFCLLFSGCKQQTEKKIVVKVPAETHVSKVIVFQMQDSGSEKKLLSRYSQGISKTKWPISGNPYPRDISSDLWSSFLQDVEKGQKWIWVHYGHKSGQTQHFVAYVGTSVIRTEPVSGAVTDVFCPSWQHPDQPHNHFGLFRIFKKNIDYFSKEHKCPMPYSMFYNNGHALHACLPRDICRLGRPASHGCTRENPETAKEMYKWTPVGTWVLITED